MAVRFLPAAAPARLAVPADRGVAARIDVPDVPRRRHLLLQPPSRLGRGEWRVAWLKSSDTAAQHPIVLAPLVWPADRLDGLDPQDLASLLFGLVMRCATYSAQYTTDYAIADAVVAMLAGPNWQTRAEQAARAGYWARSADDTGWMLVDDAEHLFHIRRKAEIEWERARKVDVSNPALTVPVRLRDGDGCRYCGHIVQWTARRGNRAGTYDHRNPGQPARTPDDLVVACGGCNRTRSNNPDADAWPLRPAPTRPYYGPESVRMLAGYGHHVPAGDPAASGTTPSDPAAGGTTPARPPRAPGTSTDLQISAGPAGRAYPSDRNPGRVGTGSGRARRGRRGRGSRDPGEGR
jgi:hypothetical protein